MLQEITNNINEALRVTQKKITSLFFDVTIGLLSGYRDKALELARITATTYYLQVIRVVRYACVLIFVVVTSAVVLGMALVLTPMALVMLAPWSNPVKMVAILFIGVFFAGGMGLLLAYLFSEKKWMDLSGSQGLFEKIIRDRDQSD